MGAKKEKPVASSSRSVFAAGLAAGCALAVGLYGGGAPPPGSPGARLLSAVSPTPVMTLHYFDIRGRGEAIRLALHDQGVVFDERPITNDEWARDRTDGLKQRMIDAGRLPFGQLPMLDAGAAGDIVQSHAILRFLGRTHGWYGGTPAALAAVDAAAEGTEDVRKRLLEKKEDPEARAIYFADGGEAQLWLGHYDALIARSPTPFVGRSPSPTHADYLLFDLLDTHEAWDPERTAAVLGELPALASWRKGMARRPGIAMYLASTARRPYKTT